MSRSFLLVPYLLIGLACATPLPIENLREDMNAAAVREALGEPEAIETEPGGAELSWSYTHEEQNLLATVVFSSIALPHCIVMTPLIAFGKGHPCFSQYVERKPVVLQFADGKLASWEVLPDRRGSFWDQGSYYHDPFPTTMTFPSKDAAHHAKGHKHHHPDC